MRSPPGAWLKRIKWWQAFGFKGVTRLSCLLGMGPDEVDEGLEHRRKLPPTRVVQEHARVVGAPIFQDPHETAGGDVLLHQFLENEGHARAVECGQRAKGHLAQHQRAVYFEH